MEAVHPNTADLSFFLFWKLYVTQPLFPHHIALQYSEKGTCIKIAVMSSKGEGKASYSSAKSSKRASYNTADKALEGKKETYLEDEYGHDYKHYAESKSDSTRRHSESDSPMANRSSEAIECLDEADREFEALLRAPNEGILFSNSNIRSYHNIFERFYCNLKRP